MWFASKNKRKKLFKYFNILFYAKSMGSKKFVKIRDNLFNITFGCQVYIRSCFISGEKPVSARRIRMACFLFYILEVGKWGKSWHRMSNALYVLGGDILKILCSWFVWINRTNVRKCACVVSFWTEKAISTTNKSNLTHARWDKTTDAEEQGELHCCLIV